MNRKRAELLVGLFLFVGLCLLAGLILKFGNVGDYFRSKYSLVLSYPSAGGLLQGSEVRLNGVAVGKVKSAPRPNEDFTGAIIELSIFDEYPIPKTARVSIKTSGFLGDSYVAISPPEIPTTDYLKEGDRIVGVPAGGLSALADSAGDISKRGKAVVDDMREALAELNSALGKLDSGILGEDNLTRFNETLVGLSEAVTKLNKDFLDEENGANLKAALENFKTTSDNLATTSQNLVSSSEKIDPIIDKANSAVSKADNAMGKADEGITEITAAARNVNSAIKKATDGPGLVSALMNDAELREDFEALISNLRETGILRYRDRAGSETSTSSQSGDRPGIFRNRKR